MHDARTVSAALYIVYNDEQENRVRSPANAFVYRTTGTRGLPENWVRSLCTTLIRFAGWYANGFQAPWVFGFAVNFASTDRVLRH